MSEWVKNVQRYRFLSAKMRLAEKNEEKTICVLFVQLAVCFCWFLLRPFFDPEVAETVFFRNIGLSPNYTVLQFRIPHSSLNDTPTTIRVSVWVVGFIWSSSLLLVTKEKWKFHVMLCFSSGCHLIRVHNYSAVSKRRLSVAGIPPRRHEFDPRSVPVGFMVGKMALGRFFSE
jgi:hypothetical protein